MRTILFYLCMQIYIFFILQTIFFNPNDRFGFNIWETNHIVAVFRKNGLNLTGIMIFVNVKIRDGVPKTDLG